VTSCCEDESPNPSPHSRTVVLPTYQEEQCTGCLHLDGAHPWVPSVGSGLVPGPMPCSRSMGPGGCLWILIEARVSCRTEIWMQRPERLATAHGRASTVEAGPRSITQRLLRSVNRRRVVSMERQSRGQTGGQVEGHAARRDPCAETWFLSTVPSIVVVRKCKVRALMQRPEPHRAVQ
jgi:hypothetical protein